jgi:hypothetical protein
MGNNQFLAIGGVVLLALTSLRFNTNILETKGTEIESKVYLTAFSLADDLIEEIKQKAFDEQTVEWKSISPSLLSSPSEFGIFDEGETSVTDFDDIDDYHGYSKTVSLPHAEKYTVTSSVDYVSAEDQNSVSSVQTYFKRVTVKVSSPYTSYPVKLSFVFTLHSK